ncbi:ATP-dependent (S)-NAD(P)H-hydrate dehydratase [Cercospora beticola]|uniref:ATP-dependent (S)-NAD(P)H-hydrate dehydratase n=2 Tax=Cercospora beticola TaxID=122368 RepID=A0A2G5IAW3_CERBT|nr:ATP-dependent (S)-NAD(P)H-hydrate dehydratase [Cercospora beticola]PIB01929.1 ATP-dependent (S)-NAD(P)H-hydrate dehydratase [Cercospora beticola]
MASNMSRKEVLGKVFKMVPPMLEKFHKGQLGRVAVIGGSEDYTGAPYFSAMASAKLGADMSHVICEPGAGAVIKTYSPNLMVHPYMRQQKNLAKDETIDSIADQVVAMLDRLHVVVIGPGLGRDPVMQETCARVITEAKKRNISFVLDADGLYLAQTRPDLVHGYKDCILTPNVVEFGRLAKSQDIDTTKEDPTKLCEKLANAFGGVTIIQKGAVDYISNGKQTLISDGEGGLKRSGGQGDTLTGSLATLLAYRKAYLERIWDHENDMSADELLTYVAYGGSAITRECSRLAFKEKGRALQASDLTEHVHTAFLDVIGEKPTDEAKL